MVGALVGRPCGVIEGRFSTVTLTFPIWNLISQWLERLEGLRQAR